MPISPARKAAYSVLMRVGAGRSFAVDLLQRDEVSRLGEADQRLTTEIVMGVLRWRGALDQKIESLSGKPYSYFDSEVATTLRMAIYQILFLAKIPRHAAVNDAVELAKWAKKRSAAGLVNAVLRKCKPLTAKLSSVDVALRDPGACALIRASTPDWMLERWERLYDVDAAFALAFASMQIPPVTLRTRAGGRAVVAAQLREQGIETAEGKFAPDALAIRGGDLYESEVFRSGEVVVQDEASQLVAALLAPRRGDRMLDLCAAPGIKTAQIAEALGEGNLVACDASAARLATMKRLLAGRISQGVRLDVMRLDATRELPFAGLFDRILVDAPCSGTGTLARNPEIKWRLRPQELDRLSKMQAALLENALAVLAPSGRLVYATCSLEPEENEKVVEAVLATNRSYRLLENEELTREFTAWAELFDFLGYFRTRPDQHRMDGFFAAVIARSSQ